MIPWGAAMKPKDVHAIIAFMRSWYPVEPIELDESPLDGDQAHGRQVFDSICASCHGRSGAGYQETANGTGIGRKSFMSNVSNGYLRYIIKMGKSQTQMKGFRDGPRAAVADLDKQEIEDVIMYLRKSAW